MAETLPEGTVTVLFTDVEGSTGLTTRRGDDAARDVLRAHEELVRQQVQEHGGREVKVLGDGFMVAFGSARKAVACAAGIQRALEENNVYGGAVNIAARISALSAPGEVLVSETVRGLARTSAGVTFEDRGEHALKGVSEPVRAWAVREGEGP